MAGQRADTDRTRRTLPIGEYWMVCQYSRRRSVSSEKHEPSFVGLL
jgi:hypothetical protein